MLWILVITLLPLNTVARLKTLFDGLTSYDNLEPGFLNASYWLCLAQRICERCDCRKKAGPRVRVTHKNING